MRPRITDRLSSPKKGVGGGNPSTLAAALLSFVCLVAVTVLVLVLVWDVTNPLARVGAPSCC
jgi:hypothetical protein